MKTVKFVLFPASAFALIIASNSAFAQSTYPEVGRAFPIEPVIRSCTQLERSAGVEADECGTMTLSEVVNIMFPGGADDN